MAFSIIHNINIFLPHKYVITSLLRLFITQGNIILTLVKRTLHLTDFFDSKNYKK